MFMAITSRVGRVSKLEAVSLRERRKTQHTVLFRQWRNVLTFRATKKAGWRTDLLGDAYLRSRLKTPKFAKARLIFFLTKRDLLLSLFTTKHSHGPPSTRETPAATTTMPQGYVKHNKFAAKKKSRGGGSRTGQGSERSPNTFHWTDKLPFQATRDLDELVDNMKETDIWNNDEESDSSENFSNAFAAETRPPSRTKCCICLEVLPVVKLMNKCNHPAACHACLYQVYIVQAQKSVENYPLKCFYPLCGRPVRETQLTQHDLVRSEKELARHHRLVVLAKAYAGKRVVVHCAKCDHPYYPGGSVHVITCYACKVRYEVLDRRTSQESTTLAAMEAFGYDRAGRNGGWARCPTCKMLISKGDGCDHMICPCGSRFNWGDAMMARTKGKRKVPVTVPMTELTDSLAEL